MRHIEKLKKIFTCCGKECSADTNGQALDQLVTLAENGELGSGGGGNIEDKYYLWNIGSEISEFAVIYLMPENIENGVTDCLIYIKGKPTIEDINEGEYLDVYIFGYGNVVKDRILINQKHDTGYFTCTNDQGSQKLYKVNDSDYSRYDGLFRIPIMDVLTFTENGLYNMESGTDGIARIHVNTGIPVLQSHFIGDKIETVVGSTGNVVVVNRCTTDCVYLTTGSIIAGVPLRDIEANGGSLDIVLKYGPGIDSFCMTVRVTIVDGESGTKTISAETISIGSNFPTDKPYTIGYMGYNE